jgi:K+-transporting ATPase ATPase C chain
MIRQLLSEIRPGLVLFLLLSLLTGLVYPAVTTGIARVALPREANGSLIERNGKIVGSELIAQPFTSSRYFWPRPSGCGYNGAASSGSNLAPSNPALADAVKTRVADFHTSDALNLAPVPPDLALASGSGLDPHITVEGALWQVPRIARERGLAEDEVRKLVARQTEGRTFGVLGEKRVNVLRLNIALDEQPNAD